MTVLNRAHQELFRRGEDERYETLDALHQFCRDQKENSSECWERPQEIVPTSDMTLCVGNEGGEFSLNHWSFSQLCKLCGLSKDTLNKLSPKTASRAIGETLPQSDKPLQLLTTNERVRSIHGVTYSRLWNADLIDAFREAAPDFRPPQKAYDGGTSQAGSRRDPREAGTAGLPYNTTQVWKEAYQAADAVHQVERDAFEKRQREFEQQKTEMLREIERLEQSHLETQAGLSEREQQLADCQQEKTALTVTNAALERNVESLRDKNEELTANLEQTRDALRLAEAQRDTAEKRSQQLETENQAAKEQQRELDRLASQVEAIAEERDRLRQEAHLNQEKLTEWVERATRAETQLQTPKRKESADD